MNQCVNHKVQTKSKQQQCQATVLKGKNFQAEKCVHMQPNGSATLMQHNKSQKSQEDDKNCQINRRPLKSKMCSDKKCQEKIVMQPVKPKNDMRLKKPAAKDKNCQVTMHNKKQVPLSKDNSCKSTGIYRKPMCSDKNCQEKENNVMRSVTRETDMRLSKPASRRLCDDNNYQSTRCYSLKEKSPRRPMYD